MHPWDAALKEGDRVSITDEGSDMYFGLGAMPKLSDRLSLGGDRTRCTVEGGVRLLTPAPSGASPSSTPDTVVRV